MRVLVTGGAGFIGSYLCEKLCDSGHKVRALDIASPSRPISGVEYISGDIRHKGTMEAAVKNVDLVYHLAAIVSVPICEKNPLLCQETNVDGTANTLSAIRLESRRKGTPVGFVFASSSAIYGNIAAPNPISEHSCGVQPPLSLYGSSKLEAEKLISSFHHQYQLPAWIFRLFNVYGKGQDCSPGRAGVISIFSESIRSGKNLRLEGGGHQVRDFISIHDVVSAFVAVASLPPETGTASPINLGSGSALSIQELAQKMLQLAQSDIRIEATEERQGDIPFSLADIDKAKSLLGWAPKIPLDYGIREVLQKTQ